MFRWRAEGRQVWFILLVPFFAAVTAEAAPSFNDVPVLECIRVGNMIFAVPTPSFLEKSDSNQGDGGKADHLGPLHCKNDPAEVDVYRLPLDRLVPETVYPGCIGDRGDIRQGSCSESFLFAVPLSREALARLTWTDLDRIGVRGVRPSELEAQNGLDIRHVVYGPYAHDGWSGHLAVAKNRYRFPDGTAFAFTCDPGQKWGGCTVSYILRLGFGLAYTVTDRTSSGSPQRVDRLVAEMIACDQKIRRYALELISSARPDKK